MQKATRMNSSCCENKRRNKKKKSKLQNIKCLDHKLNPFVIKYKVTLNHLFGEW